MTSQSTYKHILLGTILISFPFASTPASAQQQLTISSTAASFGQAPTSQLSAPQPTPSYSAQPLITPIAPAINAKGYILMDAHSGQVIASNNADERMPPASLTKMMTSYIISGALREGRIHLDDLVPISQEAWKTGGSKMFVKVGTQVSVRDLMQGIIVDSGNDACVAMAEFVAGSQESFVNLMNQQAARLGMTGTHFTDVNGLPDANHYTTPRDMAILGRALIFDFPEDYQWYSQKWFTYNNIKQPNRNRLLWRDSSVDGIKTGHTDEAGFCLVASAQRDGMRLISVVMGALSDSARAADSEKLLTYGYRFFQSHKLYAANTALTSVRVWQGVVKEIPVGLAKDFYVTLPVGHASQVKANLTINSPLKAPLQKGQPVGTIKIVLDDKTISKVSLIALQDDPVGGLWRRLVDKVLLYFHGG